MIDPIQYAITSSGDVFLLEANPQASCTVPSVSKAIGRPLSKYAALVMSSKFLKDLNFEEEVIPKHISMKEAVFPFEKFQGCDVILRPEMRSTRQVMSISSELPSAFAMAQIVACQELPLTGTVFLNLNDMTKAHLEKITVSILDLGFKIVATSGTSHFLELKGIPVDRVLKSSGGDLDQKDGRQLRQMALAYKVPVITTVARALATPEGIKSLKSSVIKMTALHELFEVKNESFFLV
ncbi:hypothetical protein DY000_02012097 [Brassica cretica]|uniref:MGS-like domain-containing protein n=1 Tax=Brassica cretica TaxID=69181 RepID=A0ABQ7CS85_BRACR|nr:hypothetical protein DY000_02012097 [Brassica cretica]